MFLLKKFLSAWLLPPFGLLVASVVLLCVAGRRKGATFFAGLLAAAAIALSLPVVADWLSAGIETYPPISAQLLASAQAIVILGGGVHYEAPEYGGDTVSRFSLERLRYGAKLARESGLPVLVTGGVVYGGEAEAALMKRVLEAEFSIPIRWSETRSRNTVENAHYSVEMLKADNIERVALVTHASHMARAKAAFEKLGIAVIPAPTDFAPRWTPAFERFLPSTGSFERSALVLRERIALFVQQR